MRATERSTNAANGFERKPKKIFFLQTINQDENYSAKSGYYFIYLQIGRHDFIEHTQNKMGKPFDINCHSLAEKAAKRE